MSLSTNEYIDIKCGIIEERLDEIQAEMREFQSDQKRLLMKIVVDLQNINGCLLGMKTNNHAIDERARFAERLIFEEEIPIELAIQRANLFFEHLEKTRHDEK